MAEEQSRILAMEGLNEVAKQLFSGAGAASALLSGFSFAAALQLVGSDNQARGSRFAIFLLYASTFLFLFAMVGFTNASARPVPLANDKPISLLRAPEDGSGAFHYTKEFYLAYAAEFLLASSAMFCFTVGAIVSAWVRNPRIGAGVLVLVIVIFAGWIGWWFMS